MVQTGVCREQNNDNVSPLYIITSQSAKAKNKKKKQKQKKAKITKAPKHKQRIYIQE